MIRRYALPVFFMSTALLCCIHLAGCTASATWLTDASSVIEAVLASISALSGVIAAFVPAAGVLSNALNIALQEVTEIQSLVSQYQTSPSETLLQKIEAAIQLVITNLQPLLSPTGVPAAAAQKLEAIAQAILSQFEAWAALIPSLKAVTTSGTASVTVSSAHVAQLAAAKSLPLDSEHFKAKINAIIAKPTGDAVVDAAFAKVKPL
jgi:hypothetical protein